MVPTLYGELCDDTLRKKAGFYKSRRLGINEYENLLFEFSYPEVATILQRKGRPYPKLDKFGQIIS